MSELFPQQSRFDSTKAVGSNKLKENKIEMMIDSMLKPSEFVQGEAIKKPEASTGKEVRHINKINFGESSGIF